MGKKRDGQVGNSQTRTLTRLMMGVAGVGLLLIIVSVGLLLSGDGTSNDVETVPPAAAAQTTYTPQATYTIPPTYTVFPTMTPLPPEPTATPLPGTPTPLPTPDSREREFVVPILMYHYVSTPPADADIYRKDLSVTPQEFRAQMQWLADNGYTAISLYDLIYALQIGWPSLPEKPIILTFDDGYIDNYDNAYPIMEEFGFTGTFFILTDWTDQQRPGYMSWDQLRELRAAGHDVEVHGRTHDQDMAGKDESWLYYHLVGPVETFEATLGYTPRFVAYISGRYDELTVAKADEYEFWGAVTTENGSLHTKDAPYQLKRIRVRGDWTLPTFEAVMESASY